jgi:hypothetical protein
MISSNYSGFTDAGRLNNAKKTLNNQYRDNVDKNYKLKQSMHGISNIEQLDTSDSLNPHTIENNKDVNKLVRDLNTNIDKMILYGNNIISLFSVSNLGGPGVPAPQGLRLVNQTDVPKLKSNLLQFNVLYRQSLEIINKIISKINFIGKSDEKLLNNLNNSFEIYFQYFTSIFYGIDPADGIYKLRIVHAQAAKNYNKAELLTDIENLNTKSELLLNKLNEITEKVYESSINPLLLGKGMLFNEIPHKFI